MSVVLNTLEIKSARRYIEVHDNIGDAFSMEYYNGDPNGVVFAHVSSLCIDRSGKLWQKTSGDDTTATPWVEISAASADTNFVTDNLRADNDREHDFQGNDLAIISIGNLDLTTQSSLDLTGDLIIENVDPNMAGTIRLKEALASTGTEWVEIKAALDVTQSYALVLPPTPPPVSGYALTGNTDGTLSWNPTSGANITSGTLSTATDARLVNFGSQTLTMFAASQMSFQSNNDFIIDAQVASIVNTANASEQATLRLYEPTSTGQNHFMDLRPADDITASFALTWPAGPPTTNGYMLTSDVTGNLSWAPPATPDDDNFRGTYIDLAELNDKADPASPEEPFITQPAALGNYAILLNTGGNPTWAAFDDEAPTNAPFVELGEGITPTVDLTVLNRTLTGFDMRTNLSSVDTPIPPATPTLAGLFTGTEKVKLADIGIFTNPYGDGASVDYPADHNFGTKALNIEVRETGGAQRKVHPLVEYTSDNRVTFKHSIAPGVNEYQYTITKVVN